MTTCLQSKISCMQMHEIQSWVSSSSKKANTSTKELVTKTRTPISSQSMSRRIKTRTCLSKEETSKEASPPTNGSSLLISHSSSISTKHSK